MKILITTVPFADKNRLPIEILEGERVEYLINPLGRKFKEDELADIIGDYDAIIAGTEIISDKVLHSAKKLKLISRVGIGLDGVDLMSAQARNILVSYTPDAPAPAVAELTIGMVISLLRNVHLANHQMHHGHWHRHFGRRISEVVFGIIGAGRIGGKVVDCLLALGATKILINEIKISEEYLKSKEIKFVDKEEIYQKADLISLHVPLGQKTKDMIRYRELKMMKSDAILINTARGGIINESDLVRVLKEGHLAAAGIDVFEQEPYNGDLKEIERCLLTSHMGSMSLDCRSQMEIEATEEVIRFFKGQELQSLVPSEEYDNRKQGL